MVFKYSITLSSFRNIESLEQTLERLVKQGYDKVDMIGDPDNIDLKSLKDTFQSFDIPVAGVTGMWGSIDSDSDGRKRRLLISEPSIVTGSQKYTKQCIDMCYSLGGEKI